MKRCGFARSVARIIVCLVVLCISAFFVVSPGVMASEPFVIAASPSLRQLLEPLSQDFEKSHPDVVIKLYFDSGLDLRRAISGMENTFSGKYFIGKGPIHMIAPGGDELITRLQQKYYVLPGSQQAYAQEQLVLVVPEALVEAPSSFEDIGPRITRLAVADPVLTTLGKQTQAALSAYGFSDSLKGRLDVATDSRGVVDHVLSGQADAGIIHGHDAYKYRDRLRVVAVADRGNAPVVHSIAMERYCPNRALCEEFMAYLKSSEAQRIVQQVGYRTPTTSKK